MRALQGRGCQSQRAAASRLADNPMKQFCELQRFDSYKQSAWLYKSSQEFCDLNSNNK